MESKEPPSQIGNRLLAIKDQIGVLIQRNVGINDELATAKLEIEERSLSSREHDAIFDRTVALRSEKHSNKTTIRSLKHERKTIEMCVAAYQAMIDDTPRQLRGF